MTFGLKAASPTQHGVEKVDECNDRKPTVNYRDAIANRKQTLKELDADIESRRNLLRDLHSESLGFYSFQAAVLVFGSSGEKLERYENLTKWLHKHGYKCSDILWVGIAILSQSPNATSFWLTKAVAAQWHLSSPKKLTDWLLEKGLATRREAEGKYSYNLIATPLLQAVLSGTPTLQAVK
jgi:hypothetical protein